MCNNELEMNELYKKRINFLVTNSQTKKKYMDITRKMKKKCRKKWIKKLIIWYNKKLKVKKILNLSVLSVDDNFLMKKWLKWHLCFTVWMLPVSQYHQSAQRHCRYVYLWFLPLVTYGVGFIILFYWTVGSYLCVPLQVL